MKKLVLAALMAIAVSSLPASIRNRETDRAVVHAQDIDPRYYAMGNPAVTDIWVDPVQGSDSNNGAARSSAVQTVNEAWNRIPSSVTPSNGGFRIQLVAGDYPESIFPSSNWMADRWGTYQFPIIFQSADGPLAAHI
ncbi:MAG TPA: hypothetical protein VJX67_20740, partial [Blastocatellia bacterium]|nr:hypothetical protein [Blastocatellia bacterium]